MFEHSPFTVGFLIPSSEPCLDSLSLSGGWSSVPEKPTPGPSLGGEPMTRLSPLTAHLSPLTSHRSPLLLVPGLNSPSGLDPSIPAFIIESLAGLRLLIIFGVTTGK